MLRIKVHMYAVVVDGVVVSVHERDPTGLISVQKIQADTLFDVAEGRQSDWTTADQIDAKIESVSVTKIGRT